MRSTAFVCLLLLIFILPAMSTQSAPPVRPRPNPNGVPEDTDRQELEKEMAKKRNQERQIQLRRDTDHLFQLSSELKQYVDKSSENTLSLDVIKKAEEIEKLARSVKDKMKGN